MEGVGFLNDHMELSPSLKPHLILPSPLNSASDHPVIVSSCDAE